MKSQHVNVNETLADQITEEAERRGISKSELTRSALRNYLEV